MAKKEQKRILLLGDSIRLGYQPVAKSILESDQDIAFEVVGPSYSTGSSVELAEKIEELLREYTPDAVHFNAGLDDVIWHLKEQRNEVSVADYTLNLQRIIDAMRPTLGSDIVFATITPVNDEAQANSGSTDGERCNREIEEYNSAAQSVMLANNILINHLDRVIQADDTAFLDTDGVSLSDAGEKAAGEAVATVVRSLWH